MRRCSVALILIVLGLGQAAIAEERSIPVAFGVQVGWALEEHIFGPERETHVQLAIGHLQVIPTLWNRPGRTFDSVQLVNELSVIESLHPGHRFIIGAGEAIRLRFRVGQNYRLFTDTGAGLTSFSLRVPNKVSGWLQYQFRVGVGVQRGPWLLEYGMTHFSNNGTLQPNVGLNLHTVLVGVNF